MPKHHSNLTTPLLILLLVTIFSALYLYLHATNLLSPLFRQNSYSSPPSNPPISTIPLSSPTPFPLIPDIGTAGTYTVSQSSQTGPTFTNVVIDPLDAQPNDQVKVTLTLSHPTHIQTVTATVQTDQKPLDFLLSLVSRDGITETWEGFFTLTQPILAKYIYQFQATSSSGTTRLPMALRN